MLISHNGLAVAAVYILLAPAHVGNCRVIQYT